MKYIIFLFLISSVLFSCTNFKPAGVILQSTPLFSAENINDRLRILPTGSRVEYTGDGAPTDTVVARAKVKFNGIEGYVDRHSVVFYGKGGVMKEDIKYPDDVSKGDFVVIDSMANGKVHLYRKTTANQTWIDEGSIDLDTANVVVAAMLDAMASEFRDEETYQWMANIAASHLDHPAIQVLNADLSEASDEALANIQKQCFLLLNKEKNQIITAKQNMGYWISTYGNDILAIPAEGIPEDESGARIKYFYSYICALPSFVKMIPKSIAVTWGVPEDADSLKAYLLYRLDRSPENIKSLFDTYGSEVRELVSGGYLLDVQPQINALIGAYDHIISMPGHDAMIKDVAKKIRRWDEDNTDEKGFNNAMYTMAEQASIYEPIMDTEKWDPRTDMQGVWYTSFWVRRIKEGNAEVVYDILKDLSTVKRESGDTSNHEGEGLTETELITCTFNDYSVGDCGHILFSCGDYGDADTSGLSDEEQKLWQDLSVEDENDGSTGNPKYIGKTFSIRLGSTRGPACNEGQGGEGIVPKILGFKLMN